MKLRETQSGDKFYLVPSDPDVKLMFTPKVWTAVYQEGVYTMCETDLNRRMKLRSDSNIKVINR